MTEKKPASEEFHRKVWKREIDIGKAKGKLQTSGNDKAELKSIKDYGEAKNDK